jgi:hypothetical protein
MITEDYISFETAKLLKEKGFDKKCFTVYNNDGKFYDTRYGIAPSIEIPAPTLQMAMKWLREVHKIEIWVHYDIDKATWWGGCNPMYEEDEENSNMFQSLLGFDYPGKTYEEACEAAIKYCLENLV